MRGSQEIGDKEEAAFQVIILGGGGGPGESDTTGILVRATATGWTKGSVMAVDAGVHLSAIEDIVRRHLPNATKAAPPTRSHRRYDHLPQFQALSSAKASRGVDRNGSDAAYFKPVTEPRGSRATSPSSSSRETVKENYVLRTGPFSDLMVPYESPSAIAAYMLRNLISTIVVTHPHLDHLSGFAINTAALGGSRKKVIAGLPKTIEAIRAHIFNDVIWPNMSDEDGGIGFVSYNRLVEGGHPALGHEDDSGYTEVCDGLEIKGKAVSHGHCMKTHKHRGSGSLEPASPTMARRRSSRMSSWAGLPGTSHGGSQPVFSDSQHFHPPSTPSPFRCVIDSSAFFIREEETGKEVLIFGDVEPDGVSEEPRNFLVWADAAPKIARGSLGAIFIECSYDDSQPDSMLFGHLAPRWLVQELAQLAGKVVAYRAGTPIEDLQTFVTAATPTDTIAGHIPLPASDDGRENGPRKKQRLQNGVKNMSIETGYETSPSHYKTRVASLSSNSMLQKPRAQRAASSISPRSSPGLLDGPAFFSKDGQAGTHERVAETRSSSKIDDGPLQSSIEGGSDVKHSTAASLSSRTTRKPLEGVKVVIIHVKDPLKDGHDAREIILRQCCEHEAKVDLGCEFHTCVRGDSIWI